MTGECASFATAILFVSLVPLARGEDEGSLKTRATVSANTPFTTTGLWAQADQTFVIRAGERERVNLSSGNGGYVVDLNGTITFAPAPITGAYSFFLAKAAPVGVPPGIGTRKFVLPEYAYVAPLPGSPYGALVAGFSPNPSAKSLADFPNGFVLVGTKAAIKAPPAGGYLYLMLNDTDYSDNIGGIVVDIF